LQLPKSFEEMGISPGYGFKQLLFSVVANALVVQTCSANETWRPERLYFRHTDWDKYQLVGIPDDFVSQESPFIHSSKPSLAYVSVRHKFSLDEEGRKSHTGSWESLHVVSLESGAEVHSVREETLRLPDGTKRGWICEIVAFGDSGLFVKAALSEDEKSFEYFVAQLDSMQTLKPIVTLPATFI
jgi:hypothetical protein